jgi:PIN domain nuclease of toxin-antitoxin system
MLNLDTHILIFALAGTLTVKERDLLASDSWGVSDIVFWELCMLVERGRVVLDLDDPGVKAVLAQLHVWPISVDVARTIDSLDFDSDPADEIIAATSVHHSVPLVTRDSRIRKSRLVPLAM